jgi:glycosyltransferase involved in cell wall biosynthesis
VRADSLSVIVSTYTWPEALDVVLRSLAFQAGSAFEVIVAEDGSGDETAAVVEHWQGTFGDRLRSVWQPDEGFRLARARNLAAFDANGDQLVFLDGDCLVRQGFIQAVRRAALPGWFLASKRLHLSAALSKRVLEDGLPIWRWSTPRWLVQSPRTLFTSHRGAGSPGVLLPLRDRRRPWRQGQPEFSPPYDGYGSLFGVHRQDFDRVNGFDMRFVGWGGEDVDIAVRLRRLGLRCGWPGPRATLLHLWHPVKKGKTKSNTPLLRETEASTRVEAVEGLGELAAELGETQLRAKRADSSSPSSEPVKR